MINNEKEISVKRLEQAFLFLVVLMIWVTLASIVPASKPALMDENIWMVCGRSFLYGFEMLMFWQAPFLIAVIFVLRRILGRDAPAKGYALLLLVFTSLLAAPSLGVVEGMGSIAILWAAMPTIFAPLFTFVLRC